MGGNPATPSKACQPCRAKRRKCDMMRPGCSQCRRANIECVGYRDAFTLKLRDQTSLAARKSHERTARSRTTSPKQEIDDEVNICALATRELAETPESLALSYFMHAYAPTAAFEYLTEISSTFLTTEPLKDALLASSLLLFSQNLRLPSVQPLAQSHYARALRSTNLALSSPDLATGDSTLLAVLLLSLFEALIFQGRTIPVNWNAHTQGASQLLRLRGERQFDNALGRHLFWHASLNIRTHCAQIGEKTPNALSTLESSHLEQLYPIGRASRFGRIVDGIANLRANKDKLTPAGHLLGLLELDSNLEDILKNLQLDAPYEVIDATTIRKSVHSYKGQIHRYPSPRMARTWNVVRIVRLFIIQMLSYVFTSHRAFGNLAKEMQARIQELVVITGTDMISDILYSVPFTLELSMNPIVSARSLIYPLSGIAVFEFALPDASEFAINRLKFIATEYGFPQAVDSTNMVRQTRDLENWIHLSVLSC